MIWILALIFHLLINNKITLNQLNNLFLLFQIIIIKTIIIRILIIKVKAIIIIQFKTVIKTRTIILRILLIIRRIKILRMLIIIHRITNKIIITFSIIIIIQEICFQVSVADFPVLVDFQAKIQQTTPATPEYEIGFKENSNYFFSFQ